MGNSMKFFNILRAKIAKKAKNESIDLLGRKNWDDFQAANKFLKIKSPYLRQAIEQKVHDVTLDDRNSNQ